MYAPPPRPPPHHTPTPTQPHTLMPPPGPTHLAGQPRRQRHRLVAAAAVKHPVHALAAADTGGGQDLHVGHRQVAGVKPPPVGIGLQHPAHVQRAARPASPLDAPLATPPMDAVRGDGQACKVLGWVGCGIGSSNEQGGRQRLASQSRQPALGIMDSLCPFCRLKSTNRQSKLLCDVLAPAHQRCLTRGRHRPHLDSWQSGQSTT